ncbi:MAG: sulfite reductase subunit alpha, partial [Alphaproteobacteria bacterium]|nr:sulfite reductase subunit alpha [Alphaproteobacteria bacterium]
MTAPLPQTAPFSHDEIKTLSAIVSRTNAHQRHWLSGFLAGIDAASTAAAAPAALPAAQSRAKEKLLILYASETGNSEGLARKAKKLAAKQNFEA